MQVRNVKYYRGQDFAAYLAMPGVSYSGLKDIPVPQSAGVSIGTRVHNYILEPEKFDWTDAGIVRKIASALREYMGPAADFLESEVAFTADFSHNGMVLQYKGRADKLKIGRLVVDFKILAGSLPGAIDRFGYDKQLSGYCLATGSPLGLIIAYNKSRKQVETHLLGPSAEFWEYTTVRMGRPELCAM